MLVMPGSMYAQWRLLTSCKTTRQNPSGETQHQVNRPVKLLQDFVHAAELLQLKPQTTQLQLGFEP